MYGATNEQWKHLVSMGLTRDLLPVVSNPNATVSPKTAIQSPGKVPSKYNDNNEIVGIYGWSDKSATEKAIENWSANPDYGICIQCRHVRALDIDIESYELSNEIQQTILAHIPNVVFRTRPNSAKFIFPFFLEGEYAKRVIHSPNGNVEFLANGQQFIAAGTHPSGVKYQMPLEKFPTLTPDEFENLFSIIAAEYGENVSTGSIRRRGPNLNLPDPIRDALIEKGLSLGTGRDGQIFIKCPMEHLHSTGSSKSSTCYFPIGTNGYPNGRFHCSHTHGKTTQDYEYQLMLNIFHEFDEVESKPDQETEDGYKPINLPRGLIKDTVEWITSSALKPQPELALLSVIAFAGAVFGRRFELDKLRTRTNLYSIAIAGTGSGKDHPRKSIKILADEANLSKFVGPDDLVSGQGIFTALTKQPSVVMLFDEIGMLFEQIKGKSAQGYMSITSKILTQLYSSSAGLYKGGVYSDPKREPVVLHSPNLCIYGTTTEETIKGFITERVINSGELNRYLFLKPQYQIPKRNFTPSDYTPPQEIINRWSKFSSEMEVYDLTAPADQPLEATIVDTDVDFREYWEYEDEQLRLSTDGTGPLYARYTENIIKIAMIFAITENHNKPLLNSIHMDIGRNIVDKSIAFMRLLTLTKAPEKNSIIDQVYAFIKQKSPTKTELLRKFRDHQSRDIDVTLRTLAEQGNIRTDIIKSGHKSVTIYKSNDVK